MKSRYPYRPAFLHDSEQCTDKPLDPNLHKERTRSFNERGVSLALRKKRLFGNWKLRVIKYFSVLS